MLVVLGKKFGDCTSLFYSGYSSCYSF